MADGKLRLGSVPYLNAKVLVEGLSPQTAHYTLEHFPPSQLAAKLKAGEVDLGLVSSVEFFRNPEYLILPGCSVSGLESMWSIKLFYRGPLNCLRRVALDPDSETTNTFLRIVLHALLKLPVELLQLPRALPPEQAEGLDGFLKIGDPCLRARYPGWSQLDLQSVWYAHTGKPFVYALWLLRKAQDLNGLEQELLAAKQRGLQRTAQIAAQYCQEIGISQERAESYVSKVVHYDLGPEEQAGLSLFGQHLAALGAIPSARPLSFYPGYIVR